MRTNYYEYKRLHQNASNLALHIFGNIVTVGFIAWCILEKHWWALIAAPFIIYPFAWTGHLVFEKNTPAAWTNPIKAKINDWKMMKELFTGRYF